MSERKIKKYGTCECGFKGMLWFFQKKYQCADCMLIDEDPPTLENNWNTHNRHSALADAREHSSRGEANAFLRKELSKKMRKHGIPKGKLNE